MRVVPFNLLLQRIIATIDRGLVKELPTSYLRSEAIAAVSLLGNLAERAEERADLLAPANREMRRLLADALDLVSGVAEGEKLVNSVRECLGAGYPSLAEENVALRRCLYDAIESLYQWQDSLNAGRLAALRLGIRTHLRGQLDQDMAIYHPVRAGRMFRGG
ncbi:MAG: hypothetical protein HY671_04110 [Chloroflexi bacterium]|nr:hypothetical protein [Chloroflexota bacterium]